MFLTCKRISHPMANRAQPAPGVAPAEALQTPGLPACMRPCPAAINHLLHMGSCLANALEKRGILPLADRHLHIHTPTCEPVRVVQVGCQRGAACCKLTCCCAYTVHGSGCAQLPV